MESTSGTYLPYFVAGEVVKGFGRGSKELNIPTVKELPEYMVNGIYFGWASVSGSPVYKMVMSIGNNPYYKNESHILHTFPEDFYGEELRLCIAGYIRPERDFGNVQELIDTIHEDIEFANKQLENSEFVNLQFHPFFV